MQALTAVLSIPTLLRLIKQWLKAPVETTDGDGRKIMAGGKAVAVGTRLTPRPPHRSERALLTHSALALDV